MNRFSGVSRCATKQDASPPDADGRLNAAREHLGPDGVEVLMTSGTAWLLALTLMQSPAPPRADVSLALSCGEQPGEVTVTIRNSGQADTAVLIGVALGNGRSYWPHELVVELRRSGSTEVEELVQRGPALIAGRMDHWVVPLPVRAAFSLRLRAADFFVTSPATAVWPAEELRVRLTGRPITSDLSLDMTGMKLWRVWTGSARSNALRLSDCAH